MCASFGAVHGSVHERSSYRAGETHSNPRAGCAALHPPYILARINNRGGSDAFVQSDCSFSPRLLASRRIAAAQDYPRKAVRVVAPFAPGGATDLLARLVSQKLSERWGQSVLVDNRTGAGGHIGAELAARSPPDGYTLLVAGAPHAIGMSLYKKLNYDLAKDLAPIGNLATYPSVIVVHPSLPVKSVKDLIALARARPGQLNFGSAGSGSPNHLAIELFKTMAKVNMVHVPYKGGSGPDGRRSPRGPGAARVDRHCRPRCLTSRPAGCA